MDFGESISLVKRALGIFGAVALLTGAPQIAFAQDEAAPAAIAAQAQANAATQAEAPAAAEGAASETASATEAADAVPAYEPLGPEMIKGQPIDRGIDVQEQYSEIGQTAVGLHNALVWVMVVISIFVLGLLLWVMIRYNRRANPTPSRTSHNTLIEVVWTLIPVLVLVLIAVPSISLLAKQYKSPPEDALTVKATGYQWYWGYTYPDNGGFEVISNMLPLEDAAKAGEPGHLAADHRMVVPVGVPIRLQTTGADVIHSFAVPSLWFKLDAVPGRLNEQTMLIKEPGIYYGQCSELCGIRHGYMPIAIEAVPMEKFEQWVLSQGGTLGDEAEEQAEAEAGADAAKLDAAAATAEDRGEAAEQESAAEAVAPTT
ncbi:MAG: cytochrome c oxidase subunit II [Sphingomonadaceae bacterium]